MLTNLAQGKYDLIVSNPPYISKLAILNIWKKM